MCILSVFYTIILYIILLVDSKNQEKEKEITFGYFVIDILKLSVSRENYTNEEINIVSNYN